MQQEVETQEETKTMRIKEKAEEMNEARGGIQGRNKEVRAMRKWLRGPRWNGRKRGIGIANWNENEACGAFRSVTCATSRW